MQLRILPIILLLLVIAIIATGAVVFNMVSDKNKLEAISSFEACKNAGYPIMESYPEQCRTPDGRNFVRSIPSLENPLGQEKTIALEETVIFEGGLSVTLLNINDSRCKEGVVCVWQGELSGTFEVSGGMNNQAPAELILATETKVSKLLGGYVFVLHNATENSVVISITKENNSVACPADAKMCADGTAVGRVAPNCEFAECPSNIVGGCYVGGCSGQICSSQKDVVTTCEYKEEYACYKNAKCERQTNGQCGWTETTALQMCLKEK